MRFLSKDRPATRLEVKIGRSVATCVHPLVSWRLTARRHRVRYFIVAGYFAAGYMTVLAALVLFA